MCKINKLQGYSKQLRRNIAVILQYRLSLLFSCSGVSNSLQLRGLQHARLPRPSLSPQVCSNLTFELMMPSSHLILCLPFLLLPSIFPASESFPMSQLQAFRGQSVGASVLQSFSISPSYEYSRLISFKIAWFDLLTAQGTPSSLLQHHNSKASLALSLLYGSAVICVHNLWKNHSSTRWTLSAK